MRIVVVLLGLALVVPSAYAHIALTYPAPRTSAQKAGPCGTAGSVRGVTVTTFDPGQTITVEWDETVAHPGHFRIAFDDDGNDVFKNPSTPSDNFSFVLVDQVADKDGTQHYTQQVTLPNITCANCTLQLMQIMTTAVPYNSFYYQCADITLVAGGGSDAGDPPPGAGGGCQSGAGTVGWGVALAALGLRRRRR